MSAKDNGAAPAASRRRPKGYTPWTPRAAQRAVLDAVLAIVDEYDAYLPLTVRQVFYRLVGAYGYPKDERAYGRLGYTLSRARRAELLPFYVLRDDGMSVMSAKHYGGLADFHDETARRARSYRRDRQHGQDHDIELWTEAAGMMAQLERVAGEYSVPVYSGGGFVSLTAVRDLVDRVTDRDRPTVLLHVGDYDPSGESIFETITEDAGRFLEDDALLPGIHYIEAERVAVLPFHVWLYGLETAPPKSTDSRSARWQGDATVQAEALPPDVLATLVRTAIESWQDEDTRDDVIAAEDRDRATLLALPRGDE
jgi:hypothetical protein